MLDWDGLTVCILAFAVYINTLGHGFVYDDNRAVLGNPDVQASSPLSNVFHNDFWGTPLSSSNSHGSYRPLCVLSFRLNHWTAGFQPFGFHLINVLLHVIATVLVLKTGRILLPGRSPSIAAGVFAVHPVHVEAVAGVVGRADVLASIFFLLSFLCYVKHVKVRDSIFISKSYFTKELSCRTKSNIKRTSVPKRSIDTFFTIEKEVCKRFCCLKYLPREKTVYLSLFLVFAVCAVLSKEPGITVIPLAVCYDIILHLPSKKLPKMGSLIGASASTSLASFVVILLVRLCIMGLHTPSFSKADNPTAKEASMLTRTITFLYLPVFNFILLVFPRWLSFDWSMDAIPRVTLFDCRFVLSLGFYYLLYRTTKLALSWKAQKSKIFSKPKYCKVCNVNAAEEHLQTCKMINNNNLPQQCNCLTPSYQPLSWGPTVTMCLAFIVIPFIPATNLFFYVGFVVAERVLYLPSVGFCLLVALGAHVLWSYHRPLALGGYLLLLAALSARTLQRNSDWSSEESLYRSAIDINPPKAYGNLGSILSSAGRLEEAEVALRKALDNRPNMADVHFNLGNLHRSQNKPQEAMESYTQAIRYRPSLAVAYLNLGHVLRSLGQWQEAETTYRKCSQLDVSGLKDPKAHEDARTSCLKQLRGVCTRINCQGDTWKYLRQHVKGKESNLPHKDSSRNPELNVQFSNQNLISKITSLRMFSKNKTRATEAEDVFQRALQKAPTDPSVFVNYGQMLAQAGRRDEAAALYLRAAQLAPHQHELVTSAAVALRHAGRLTEAEALYRQARDLRPRDSTSHSNLGAIYHLQGKYRQAAISYKEALRLSPGDLVTLTNLQKLRNIVSRNKR